MKAQARTQQHQSYKWPVSIAAYDRSLALSAAEKAELEFLVPRDGALGMKLNRRSFAVLQRLVQPIKDVLAFTGANQAIYYCLFRIVARQTNILDRTFWSWTERGGSRCFVQRSASSCVAINRVAMCDLT
jgi:hypothetical protein